MKVRKILLFMCSFIAISFLLFGCDEKLIKTDDEMSQSSVSVQSSMPTESEKQIVDYEYSLNRLIEILDNTKNKDILNISANIIDYYNNKVDTNKSRKNNYSLDFLNQYGIISSKNWYRSNENLNNYIFENVLVEPSSYNTDYSFIEWDKYAISSREWYDFTNVTAYRIDNKIFLESTDSFFYIDPFVFDIGANFEFFNVTLAIEVDLETKQWIKQTITTDYIATYPGYTRAGIYVIELELEDTQSEVIIPYETMDFVRYETQKNDSKKKAFINENTPNYPSAKNDYLIEDDIISLANKSIDTYAFFDSVNRKFVNYSYQIQHIAVFDSVTFEILYIFDEEADCYCIDNGFLYYFINDGIDVYDLSDYSIVKRYDGYKSNNMNYRIWVHNGFLLTNENGYCIFNLETGEKMRTFLGYSSVGIDKNNNTAVFYHANTTNVIVIDTTNLNVISTFHTNISSGSIYLIGKYLQFKNGYDELKSSFVYNRFFDIEKKEEVFNYDILKSGLRDFIPKRIHYYDEKYIVVTGSSYAINQLAVYNRFTEEYIYVCDNIIGDFITLIDDVLYFSVINGYILAYQFDLSKIDYEIENNISTGVSENAEAIIFSSSNYFIDSCCDTNYIYTLTTEKSINIYDLSNLKLLKTLSFDTQPVSFDSKNGKLVVCFGINDEIYLYDCNDWTFKIYNASSRVYDVKIFENEIIFVGYIHNLRSYFIYLLNINSSKETDLHIFCSNKPCIELDSIEKKLYVSNTFEEDLISIDLNTLSIDEVRTYTFENPNYLITSDNLHIYYNGNMLDKETLVRKKTDFYSTLYATEDENYYNGVFYYDGPFVIYSIIRDDVHYSVVYNKLIEARIEVIGYYSKAVVNHDSIILLSSYSHSIAIIPY